MLGFVGSVGSILKYEACWGLSDADLGVLVAFFTVCYALEVRSRMSFKIYYVRLQLISGIAENGFVFRVFMSVQLV